MKKAFKNAASVVIASSMLASLVPAAFAADDVYNRDSLQEAIKTAAKAKGIEYTYDGTTLSGTAKITLDADTDVKRPTASSYADRVLSSSAKEGNAATVTGDFKSFLFMAPVRDAFKAYQEAAEAEVKKDSVMSLLLPTIPVTGEFTIVTTYDENMQIADKEKFLTAADGNAISESNPGTMEGFNDAAKEIFYDVARTDEADADHPGYRKFTVKVKVKAPTSTELWGTTHEGEWADTLVYADLDKFCDTLLADIDFTIPAVTVSKTSMDKDTYYTESIDMTGSITIGKALSKISFDTVQGNPTKATDGKNEYTGAEDWEDISATLALRLSTGSTSSSSSSVKTSTPAPVRPTLAPGETATPDPNATVDPDATPDPNATVDPNASPVPGGNTPTGPLPNMDENGNFVPSNHTVPSALNGEDHMVYVIGYPEGDVRPLRSITREEIATIFYRLLTDAKRDSIYTKESPFSDVLKSRWSNKAIATMANGKYILGDAGATTFRPADAITRAEMAAIVSRFLDTTPEIKDISEDFTDLGGHWAAEAVAQGVAAGWLTGYTDHSFKPDQLITRAEAMTVINRMLVRYVREGGLAEGYVEWPDNPKDAWYYYNVVEATNSHEYNTRTFETTDDYYETWPSIITNWIWGDFKTAYEDPDEIDKQ